MPPETPPVLKIAGYDCDYDANGNLTRDNNKGLGSISYNVLNLPNVLSKDGSNSIRYIYDATGSKLCKEATVNGTTTRRYYCGSMEYDDTRALSLIHTDEGLVEVSGSGSNITYNYEYFLKDHLGNTRVVVNSSGSLLQRSDYYPFGLTADQYSTSTDNKYLYNGKELQQDLGLGLYDYGARFYDPQIGRWHVVDPMAEANFNFSPYCYTLNNPLRFVDPDGRDVEPIEGGYRYTGLDAQLLLTQLQAQSKSKGGIPRLDPDKIELDNQKIRMWFDPFKEQINSQAAKYNISPIQIALVLLRENMTKMSTRFYNVYLMDIKELTEALYDTRSIETKDQWSLGITQMKVELGIEINLGIDENMYNAWKREMLSSESGRSKYNEIWNSVKDDLSDPQTAICYLAKYIKLLNDRHPGSTNEDILKDYIRGPQLNRDPTKPRSQLVDKYWNKVSKYLDVVKEAIK